MTYFRPTSLEDALAALAEPLPSPRRVLCGGTDAYADPGARPPAGGWIDISRLDALHGIAPRDGELRIGAATSWDTIEAGSSAQRRTRWARARSASRAAWAATSATRRRRRMACRRC